MTLFKDQFHNPQNLNFETAYFAKYNTAKTGIDIISVDLPKAHIEEVNKNLSKNFDLSVEGFNIEHSLEDTVYEFTDYSGLKFYKCLCEHFGITKSPNNSNNNEVVNIKENIFSPNALKFIIYHFTDSSSVETKDIYIFVKQDRVALNKKRAIYAREDSDFTLKSNDKFYMFSTYPTCVFIDSKVFVIDFKKFIDLFIYKEHLKIHVEKAINLIESTKIISNFTDFETEIKHYRNFNALTKVTADLNELQTHLDKHSSLISRIQNDYICNFNFDSNKKSFKIENESGLKLVIRILSNQAGFNFNQELMTFSSTNLVPKK